MEYQRIIIKLTSFGYPAAYTGSTNVACVYIYIYIYIYTHEQQYQ